MTWRDRALVALAEQGLEPRHAQAHEVAQHGHGPICCCMMQLCRSDACNVNAKIIELMESPRQCSNPVPTMSPQAERCALPEGHEGPCVA